MIYLTFFILYSHTPRIARKSCEISEGIEPSVGDQIRLIFWECSYIEDILFSDENKDVNSSVSFR